MPSAKTSKSQSPFMGLPTGIREMILRYLLIARYTIVEHRMKSKEYDMRREYLLDSADQTHHFFTAVMSTCRRIYEESVNLCRRENDFVCVTSSRPPNLFKVIGNQGLELIAQGPKSRGFWNISMTLTFDLEYSDSRPFSGSSGSKDELPWQYIFCHDELPTFCRLFLELCHSSDERILRSTAIHVSINDDIWIGEPQELDRSPVGLSRIDKLLEPLCQLHSFKAAQIEGPLSDICKESIITNLCRDCRFALRVMDSAEEALSGGDEKVRQNYPFQGLQKYKIALNHTLSCCWLYDERNWILLSTPFPGLKFEQVLSNLRVRLQARIASVYFDIGMFRMARIYTERALNPCRPYYDGNWKDYDLESLELQPWQHVVFAEVLHVSAQNLYRDGKVSQAIAAVQQANRYVPINKEQQCRLDLWQERADKRAKQDALRQLRLQKRIEENFLVVCNWKKKGDRLLESGRSELAASTYETALSKVELIDQDRYFQITSGTFKGYLVTDGINAIRFKLQASVAACCLMSRRYTDIAQWIDAALKCSNSDSRACRGCRHNYWDQKRDWTRDQREDYLKAHYCKAFALKELGDTEGAIKHLEKALGLESKVFVQLEPLKQKQKIGQLRENFERSLVAEEADGSQI